MFIGITLLANQFQSSLFHIPMFVSQVARGIGEAASVSYFLIATLLILSLAANTAYADFPRLASLIAKDRFLPRQLTNLGDRLVFSNGIVTLAVLSSVLIILFDAREHNLLPLYAVGVFISFTLSQAGMVVHWLKERHQKGFRPTGYGAFTLGSTVSARCARIVSIVLMVTKFAEGAWIVTLAIPAVIFMFTRIHKHYEEVAASLTLDGIKRPPAIPIPTTPTCPSSC
jgi:amino acid transporter